MSKAYSITASLHTSEDDGRDQLERFSDGLLDSHLSHFAPRVGISDEQVRMAMEEDSAWLQIGMFSSFLGKPYQKEVPSTYTAFNEAAMTGKAVVRCKKLFLQRNIDVKGETKFRIALPR